MRIFRAVAPPKRLHKTNDFAAFLKSGFYKGEINQVREEWVCGDNNMAAGNQDAMGESPKFHKKIPQCGKVRVA